MIGDRHLFIRSHPHEWRTVDSLPEVLILPYFYVCKYRAEHALTGAQDIGGALNRMEKLKVHSRGKMLPA